MAQTSIPAVFVRGGTSKGLIFDAADLPDDGAARDRILLDALGSPDPYGRQIDGLGGASSSTSKAAIVSRSARPDCDVDYLVGQVEIREPIVDYSSNCGNLSSAIGPYAIDHGLVAATGDLTEVRIWQVNTGRRIVARVPTKDGRPVEAGDYEIDGVARPGARIDLRFFDPAGSSTGKLLPTGNLRDELVIPGRGALEVSIVDASLTVVFVRAADLGLTATELKPQIDSDPGVLRTLEAIRGQAAVTLGVVADASRAVKVSPALPKVAFVAPPRGYVAASGRAVDAGRVDLNARIMSMGALHHAYEVTGAIATAVAAALPGTVVADVCALGGGFEKEVRIGHTSGTIAVGVSLEAGTDGLTVRSASLGRTTRVIMRGSVLVPGHA